MKLLDIFSSGFDAAEWEQKGYQLPKFDIAAVREKTRKEPTWVHFGGGNIFRAFPASMLNDALNTGRYDRGVIVAETFDFEVVDKAYAPYDNLSLSVALKSDGTVEKKVIASVTEALKADYQFEDWNRLVEIFRAPSLQMISFTITEKGYGYNEADLARGLKPVFALGKVTALLCERWNAGSLPLTIQSMDNCSHNGDRVKAGVMAYAERWVKDGLVPQAFLDYLRDENLITFPWSMIDKITPRPHSKVKEMLAEECAPEFQALKDRIVPLVDLYEQALMHVKEAGSQEMTDFLARRLYEITADILMSLLIIADASRNAELFGKSAHVYVRMAEAEVAAHAAYISHFKEEDLPHFRVAE